MNFEHLTNLEVINFLNQAKDDLDDATRDQPESEWHQSCFAAVLVMSQEALRRGLRFGTVH